MVMSSKDWGFVSIFPGKTLQIFSYQYVGKTDDRHLGEGLCLPVRPDRAYGSAMIVLIISSLSKLPLMARASSLRIDNSSTALLSSLFF